MARFLIVCGGSGVGLLGQRRVLDVDAELQVDVSGENVIEQRKVRDSRSFSVNLDQRIGTVGAVLSQTIKNIGKSPANDEHVSSYLKRGINNPVDIKHIQFADEHFTTTASLERGLAQSPSIGGATVRHEVNRDALKQKFREMITPARVGPQSTVEVWIVSSTAGGTGEGTHRYVAAELAHFIKTNYQDTTITINFIRVGQFTYRTVNYSRTALNTFLGIAADSAFAVKARDDFGDALVTYWFYVDLPDVGTGDRSIPLRREVVEMASKAIMLPDLQKDLQSLLVNNQGIPMVLVRAGYWGKDFGENLKYLETLKQLRIKLTGLVEPNYADTYIKGAEPQFRSPGLDDKIRLVQDAKYVLERKQGGWQFPRYRLRGFPGSLQPIQDLLNNWKASMRDLLDIDIEDLTAEFWVEELTQTGEQEQRETVPLTVPATIEQQGEEWFKQVDSTHRALAWSRHLLGIDFRDRSPKGNKEKLFRELLDQAKEISKELYGFNPFASSDKRAQSASSLLGGFLSTLVKVNRLLELERSATRLLDGALSESRAVLKMVNEEFEVTKSIVGSTPTTSTNAAELSHVLDRLEHKTWLQLLCGAVRRGDFLQFKEQVLRGATGLTEAGLRSVLNLQSSSEITDIQNALATQVGCMLDSNGKEHEAPWWADVEPTPTLKYEYRILPHVDRQLQARLRSQAEINGIEYRYVFTEMGMIGLYVMAFLGVSLTKERGDTISMPVFLMNPFVPSVKEALKKWSENPVPNEPCGQLEIVGAGVCGEPLYERAMLGAGLSKDDVKKISEFYQLVN